MQRLRRDIGAAHWWLTGISVVLMVGFVVAFWLGVVPDLARERAADAGVREMQQRFDERTTARDGR